VARRTQGACTPTPAALAAIETEVEQAARPGSAPGLLVSAISCWEVAMLVQRGRLALRLEVERWLATVAAIPAIRLLPLDPADRFLVAQARELAVPLLSADRRIWDYPHSQTLW
jgi:PIN domain nuclease of toxin-antitoxin system